MFNSKLLPLVVLLTACEPKPASLVVQPESLHTTSLKNVSVLKTILSDSEGRPLKGVRCTFRSANPTIAQAKNDGSVEYKAPGKTTISVHCVHLEATVPVRVGIPVRLDFKAVCKNLCVTVSPNPWKIRLVGEGSMAKLVTRVFDFEGKQIPNIKAQYEIVNTDSRSAKKPAGIVLSEDMVYNHGKEGQYVILAIVGNLYARLLVDVVMPVVDEVKAPLLIRLAPGEQYQLSPQTFRRTSQGMQPVAGARISYISRKPWIAEVSDQGLIQGRLPGKTEVLAVADGGSFAQIIIRVTKTMHSRKNR